MPLDDWRTGPGHQPHRRLPLHQAGPGGHAQGALGRIVNVSSVVAERANPGQANYVAAKAGLLGYTRTVAKEMGKRGITCNAVTPGVIETEMTAGVADDLKAAVPAGRARPPGGGRRTPSPSCLRRGGLRQRGHAGRRRGTRRLAPAHPTEDRAGASDDTHHHEQADQTDVLQTIRDELAGIKVPGAQEATPETTWARPRRRLARPRRARQGARGPLRGPDRRRRAEEDRVGRRRHRARRVACGRERRRRSARRGRGHRRGSCPRSGRARRRCSTP